MAFLPKKIDAKKLFVLECKTSSFIETPGVTNSVTPLLTIVLVIFGSSNWSQIATRRPAFTNFGKYVFIEWCGKPAKAVSVSEPAPLFVSVIPSIFDARTASSPKVS